MRRVSLPLLAIILVVSVVVSLWQLGRISDMVLLSLRDVGLLAALIADLAPGFAGLALGAAGIFGCVLAYDRLAEDGELAAMAAGGVPPWRVLRPAYLSGTVLGLVVLCAGVWGEPWGAAKYSQDVALLATRSFSRTLRPGTFNNVGGIASIYIGRARVDDRGNAIWSDMVLGRDLATGPMVLAAKEARVKPAGVGLLDLTTTNGQVMLPSADPRDVTIMRFEEATVTVDVASWVGSQTMSLYDFQSWELGRLVEQAEVGPPGHARDKLTFHLWQKLFLPFGMPLLCLIGAMGGGQRGSQARARAYLTAALAVAAYFGLLAFGRNLALQGVIPAWLGANVGNLAAVAALTWLWRARSRMGA
ncbi:MAG: LptF/LptG family permease [Myxococcota bacterium]